MEHISILTLTTIVCALAIPRTTKHYRSDYEYNPRTDSFYKLHTEAREIYAAKGFCEIEGAKLMLLENEHDLQQAHGMFKRYPDLSQYAFVESDGQKHERAEENPTIDLSQELRIHVTSTPCEVVTRNGHIETYPCYERLPFICKVKASDVYYDSRCEVFGRGYNYIEALGSCYKVPQRAYSWNEAYADCRAEGSHLMVLNSLAESQAMQNLTRHSWAIRAKYPWFFFAGYRAEPPQGNETVVFKTIFNQTLEEAGFDSWSPNEPNNAGNEYCGTFFRNDGKLNDVNCAHEYGFICEKEIQIKN